MIVLTSSLYILKSTPPNKLGYLYTPHVQAGTAGTPRRATCFTLAKLNTVPHIDMAFDQVSGLRTVIGAYNTSFT